MDLKKVIELLDEGRAPADKMTGACLEAAIAAFAGNPGAAGEEIRHLQATDPAGFLLSALHLLDCRSDKTPALQYLAGLVFSGNLLMAALLDAEGLPSKAAMELARNLARAEPLLDARLMRTLIGDSGGDVCAVKTSTAMRALQLVDEISDCSRLGSHLIQLLRHPSAGVRSKAALLLGRTNLNLGRVKSFLGSEDPRFRANAVESLWGHQSAGVEQLLRQASHDLSGRASINALLELSRRNDCSARGHLMKLASSADPTLRAGAAWAMGEIGCPEAAPFLDQLAQDPDAGVRAMAIKSRSKLRPPPTRKTVSRKEAGPSAPLRQSS